MNYFRPEEVQILLTFVVGVAAIALLAAVFLWLVGRGNKR